jgi:S-adenosylmethionine-diacylglycerol 3-amino-3-carboxypropyl transferase
VSDSVRDAAFFDHVGYATVWEDERCIDEGLRPRPGDRVLSITSGGDFSLQFLLADVASVLSVDFNPRQDFLLGLKVAALAELSHDELWRFCGLESCGDRAALHARLRHRLPEDAREYWDRQRGPIERGFLSGAKQDRFLHRAGAVITAVLGRRAVERYFASETLAEQRAAIGPSLRGLPWRALARVLFSRAVFNRAFDRAHFRYATREHHPASLLREQVEGVFLDLPARENFPYHWAFRRGFRDREHCPAWLRASGHDNLRDRLGRLTSTVADLEKVLEGLPDGSLDCFHFSNAFDWVSPTQFLVLMGEVVRVARPGARLCYWTNLFNTRRELGLAVGALGGIREERELADRIHRASRTPGYSSCTVGTITKEW